MKNIHLYKILYIGMIMIINMSCSLGEEIYIYRNGSEVYSTNDVTGLNHRVFVNLQAKSYLTSQKSDCISFKPPNTLNFTVDETMIPSILVQYNFSCSLYQQFSLAESVGYKLIIFYKKSSYSDNFDNKQRLFSVKLSNGAVAALVPQNVAQHLELYKDNPDYVLLYKQGRQIFVLYALPLTLLSIGVSISIMIVLVYYWSKSYNRIVFLSATTKIIKHLPCRRFVPINSSDNEINPDDLSCAICLENYRRYELISYLPCKHDFHQKCLLKWDKAICPLCKRTFPVIDEQNDNNDNNNNNQSIDTVEQDLGVESLVSSVESTPIEIFLEEQNAYLAPVKEYLEKEDISLKPNLISDTDQETNIVCNDSVKDTSNNCTENINKVEKKLDNNILNETTLEENAISINSYNTKKEIVIDKNNLPENLLPDDNFLSSDSDDKDPLIKD